MLSAEDIQLIVTSGEGYNAEFKFAVPSKVRELTEEVSAFANASGGVLLLGIDDHNQIKGIHIDNAKRPAIQNSISDISPTDFGKRSHSRNPLIFGLFAKMHLVEQIGSGINRMNESMKATNLPPQVSDPT